MISPLFIEIFGGLLFITLLWVMPIYMANLKEEKDIAQMIDKRNYEKSLKAYAQNPHSHNTRNLVLTCGDKYYAHQFPDVKDYTSLEYAVLNTHLPSPKEVRFSLINRDMKAQDRSQKAA